MPPKPNPALDNNNEGLTPLEAALIRRVEDAINGMREEVAILRRHSGFATLALWLLTVFAVAALINSTGGDAKQAAEAASVLSGALSPASASTATEIPK